MSIYFTVIIQVLLVIHVLKTGRNRYWIWLLIFVPLVGGLAYLFIEIIPEFRGGIQGQRAMRNVRNAVNPGAELQKHAAAWEQSANADNARRYANALMNHGHYSQAGEVLEQALSGFFATEPGLLLLKARAKFETSDSAGAVRVLEELQKANPDFRSAQGHMLYARSLEESGRMEEALDEFQEVSRYFPGVEARYRLTLALAAAGKTQDAIHELEQLSKDAGLAPAHFRKSQKKWLNLVKEQLKQLQH